MKRDFGVFLLFFVFPWHKGSLPSCSPVSELPPPVSGPAGPAQPCREHTAISPSKAGGITNKTPTIKIQFSLHPVYNQQFATRRPPRPPYSGRMLVLLSHRASPGVSHPDPQQPSQEQHGKSQPDSGFPSLAFDWAPLRHSSWFLHAHPSAESHWENWGSSGAGVQLCLYSSPFWAHTPSWGFKEINILWSMGISKTRLPGSSTIFFFFLLHHCSNNRVK